MKARGEYPRPRTEFDETELAQLTSVTIAISSWNRIAVSYRFLHPDK